MARNSLQQLIALGQSVWLDDIRRRWLIDGTLARLIDRDGVSGLTANPTIIERAISPDFIDSGGWPGSVESTAGVRCNDSSP